MKHILAMLTFATACTGTPSGATCPTNNQPTYDDFAKPFVTKYCTSCHSVDAKYRYGAPADINFDSKADLVLHAAAVDEVSAKGPNATNTAMPEMSGPVHEAPTADEREMLGQFLACEAPR